MTACFLTFATVLWTIGPFHRPPNPEPVIRPDASAVFNDPIRHELVRWEALHTFNPAAMVRDGKIYVLYRAEDNTGDNKIGGHTSRIGLAMSEDGIHFTRDPQPVLYPENDSEKSREWPGGCEDPRIVESETGEYVVAYTQWNQVTYDVGIATSTDLRHWTKYGPAFANAFNGKYKDLKYKSAGILTKLVGDRLLAAKIHGVYWMYWGEIEVHLASSPDLIHWYPLEKRDGTLVTVLSSRPHSFDSSFPEVGPPPVLTDNGIVLIYNGKNAVHDGDAALAADTYAAGQALFLGGYPDRLVNELSQPFLKPELPWERSGQYAAGTTFTEGLVHFRNRWVLYYGSADSLVGVAISDETAH
jgi:predicted GH43/DUF377 family glycosyl hydrolase